MKSIKLILWFVVGLFLGGYASFSLAEVITGDAVKGAPYKVNNWYPTMNQACTDYFSQAGTGIDTTTAPGNKFKCKRTADGATSPEVGVASMLCPNDTNPQNGGSGVLRNGVYVCVAATCPAGQTANPVTGRCEAPQEPCPVYNGTATDAYAATQPSSCSCPSGTKWWPYNGCRKTCGTAGGAANAGFDLAIAKGAATGCFGGCEVQQGAGYYDILKDGSHSAPATYTGWACAGTGLGSKPTGDGQPEPDSSKLDPTKKHPPKCGAGEGVITSSSGSVSCLPAGTPNTSTPKVESSKKTETFPDASTKTTETTKTTDPTTGASTTTTTETATGGQSGTAGTKSSTENGTGTDGNGDGDGDGDCDPTLHFCGGPATDKLYTKKEKTMESVFQQFKTTISGSGLGSATTGFFNVSAPGGSCPSWSVQVPYLNVTLSGADIFCGGAILAALQGAGAVMLALATYIAFTWAFL